MKPSRYLGDFESFFFHLYTTLHHACQTNCSTRTQLYYLQRHFLRDRKPTISSAPSTHNCKHCMHNSINNTSTSTVQPMTPKYPKRLGIVFRIFRHGHGAYRDRDVMFGFICVDILNHCPGTSAETVAICLLICKETMDGISQIQK